MARLLLVEDEAQLREQLMEILDRHQYQVDYCVDGAEAMGFQIEMTTTLLLSIWGCREFPVWM